MKNLASMFLSQSYQDCWEDYMLSVRTNTIPHWDYVVLTASNELQAEGYRTQIADRKDMLPKNTRFLVIPDEGGVRVGSGGATLSVLRKLKEEAGSFSGLRTLVIHSGGDSKRVPQYSALGKLFSPVPHTLPNGRPSTLFDEFLIGMASVPARIKEGMLLLSGDVLLLFNPLQIDYSSDAAAISFKEDVETGKNHGVYLMGENGNVKQCLQKQSVETLTNCGAVNESGCVDIDTGAVIFSRAMLDALYTLVDTEEKYKNTVNDTVRLSLYADFLYPLAEDSTLEKFYLEKPEGSFCEELTRARKDVWEALRPFRMKLLRMAPAKFIHFGTTREILELMQHGVEEYSDLGWKKIVQSSIENGRASGYNSMLESGATIGEGCYLEVSCVGRHATIGSGTVLSYIDVQDETIPDNVVLHGLKQKNGKFVCRIFGTGDNPKADKLFGKPLTEEALWDEGDEHTLWNAKLYAEKDTIKEAVASSLSLYEAIVNGKKVEVTNARSLKSGFLSADPDAIVAWNRRMAQLVRMEEIAKAIENRIPAKSLARMSSLTKIQKEWLQNRLAKASFSQKIRLYYYLGTVLDDEAMFKQCFATISQEIQRDAMAKLSFNDDAKIVCDRHSVKLPLRVNWGGGWSDTPPYCNENGGTVLNAAILLAGEMPVEVTLVKIPEHKIVFDSRDMDVHGEFESIEFLQSTGDPYDPFALQKACLLACGVIPRKGHNLDAILTRMGGGFEMHSEVTGVPKGSGLGTSSILSAACVKAVTEFLGMELSQDELCSRVLVMEQIMSTGGGWQDQVGGLAQGVKYISSFEGISQELRVTQVDIPESAKRELEQRFVLIYTGQRRLARNLLRSVIGRYIGNESDSLFALEEIRKVAALMRFELERGNVDGFAKMLDYHWELSQKVDAGSTNTLINQIFASIDDLIDGRLVCGAGGGGFLQAILKKGVTREQVQKRLQEIFQDSPVSLADAQILW